MNLSTAQPTPPQPAVGIDETITTRAIDRNVYYFVGKGGGGGSRGNPSAGDGEDGDASKFIYSITTTTRTYSNGNLTNTSSSTEYYDTIANGGGKGYGGNGISGTDAGVGGLKTGSSSLSRDGNNGSLGGVGGVPTDGGYSGLWANYDYRGLIGKGRGGRGGNGARYTNDSTAGNSGNTGYIRMYFLR